MIELELLIAAPDRECAEVMALAALYAGASAEQLRTSWNAWQARHRFAVMRGEEMAA